MPEKQGSAAAGGAKSGAVGDGSEGTDPQLAVVARAWPTLPENVRAAILAMVKAAVG